MKPHTAYGLQNPEFKLVSFFNNNAPRPWKIIEGSGRANHKMVSRDYGLVASASTVMGGLSQLYKLKAKFEAI